MIPLQVERFCSLSPKQLNSLVFLKLLRKIGRKINLTQSCANYQRDSIMKKGKQVWKTKLACNRRYQNIILSLMIVS